MKKTIFFILFALVISFKPIISYSSPSFCDYTIFHSQLTAEEAKELLLKYNSNVDYIYQGDAEQFHALKSKNLQGYVFLPNVDTDIGYFVDKNTGSIYFFHPSGYLKLVEQTVH